MTSTLPSTTPSLLKVGLLLELSLILTLVPSWSWPVGGVVIGPDKSPPLPNPQTQWERSLEEVPTLQSVQIIAPAELYFPASHNVQVEEDVAEVAELWERAWN